MKKIEIIKADLNNETHADAVLKLTNAYARDPMGMSRPLPEKVKNTLIDKLKEFPCSFQMIAWADEEPSGIANCVLSFSTFYAARVVNIHDLAVAPKYRGAGLGGALLNAVEKEAIKLGCCKVTLEVREDNRARNLYKRFGFSSGEPQMYFMEKMLGSGVDNQ